MAVVREICVDGSMRPYIHVHMYEYMFVSLCRFFLADAPNKRCVLSSVSQLANSIRVMARWSSCALYSLSRIRGNGGYDSHCRYKTPIMNNQGTDS